MRFVVVMDAADAVHWQKDTTFAVMHAAQARGHHVDHCMVSDLYLEAGRVYASVRPATMQLVAERPIVLDEREDVCLHDIDAVLVRKDPPFDLEYLWCVQMLELLRGDTFVMNDARGLREANEKLYTCHFPELMPRTLVASEHNRIRQFVQAVGGRAVIKPLSGARGEGVFVLAADDLNFNAIVEHQTDRGRRVAMVQEFLPAVHEGDKRILVLGGEPLGALLRVPAQGDVRSNLAAGGSAVKTGVTEADRRLIATLKPKLLADGLYFVGIDLIGGLLTEVNVTSPTGIQQMSRLDGVSYSDEVVGWLERNSASLLTVDG
jgi:glutathione synthase